MGPHQHHREQPKGTIGEPGRSGERGGTVSRRRKRFTGGRYRVAYHDIYPIHDAQVRQSRGRVSGTQATCLVPIHGATPRWEEVCFDVYRFVPGQ